MIVEWLLGQSAPQERAIVPRQTSNKKPSSNGSATSSTESTPALEPAAKKLSEPGGPYFNLCYREECGIECASDEAVSLAAWEEDEDDDELEGGVPPHFQNLRHRRSMFTNKTGDATGKYTGKTDQDLRRTGSIVTGRSITPPNSITLYRPRKAWPDGTLQILWQKKERDMFGLKGLDKFEAYIDLNLDDLSTIEIENNDELSSIAGTKIELHPDETIIKRIGSITCYSIRHSSLQGLPSDLQNSKDSGIPDQLEELLKHLLKQPNKLFQSWRQNDSKRNKKKKGTKADEVAVQEMYWKHHWHPTTSVTSYLWIEDVTIDENYRGIGLGLCLLEDACRRVADAASWIMVSFPRPEKSSNEKSSLQEYFELMGFLPLAPLVPFTSSETPTTRKKRGHDDKAMEEDSTLFLARWNATPFNPRLDEVLPSVPFTAQQSKDQGFYL